MTIREGDLVRVAPLYFELIDPRKNHKKFWEIAPAEWDRTGYITTFTTAWGRIGCKGQSKKRSAGSEHKLNEMIYSKERKGYVRKKRPSSRATVQIEGLEDGNVGLVIEVNPRSYRPTATLLLDGQLVHFPIRFLTVISSG